MENSSLNINADGKEAVKKRFAMVRELREDCARQQKKGLHFILTSVIIWSIIFVVQLLPLSVMLRNMLTFCASVPLCPMAYGISKLIKVDFQGKSNPLTSLGILFTVNQMIYLLIAMWVFSAVPEKLVMVYAMIFGAHLLPYGWLYLSKSYYVFAGVIPVLALVLGLSFSSAVVAGVMILMEVVFCICLVAEVKKPEGQKQ